MAVFRTTLAFNRGVQDLELDVLQYMRGLKWTADVTATQERVLAQHETGQKSVMEKTKKK